MCTCDAYGECGWCGWCLQRIAAAEDTTTPLDYDRGADWNYPLDYPF